MPGVGGARVASAEVLCESERACAEVCARGAEAGAAGCAASPRRPERMLAKKSKKWRRFPANRARFFHPPRRIFSGAKNWHSPRLFAHRTRVARPVPRQPKRERARAIFALFSRTTGTLKRSLFVDKTAWPTCGHVTASPNNSRDPALPGSLPQFADAPRLVDRAPSVFYPGRAARSLSLIHI